MDYLLKNALIDTTIMVSAILFLFLAFRFLAKNVAADSIIGRSKRWSKKLTMLSVTSIIFFYLIFYQVSFGVIINKIMIVFAVIFPFLALSALILLSLTHWSARVRLISIFKNSYTSWAFALSSLVFSAVLALFVQFVRLVLSNLDGVDNKELTEAFDPGKPKSATEDQSRLDIDISASGYYDLSGKYKKGHEWMDLD